MRMYEGKVIYSCSDQEGPIDVVDEPTARTLYFGSPARQSTVFLERPQDLALAYTRCMVSGLLFCEAPQKVLLLGLGGGSLARFLLHAFPQCRVQAVEKRARVVELARQYFFLGSDPRLSVCVEPAETFLHRTSEQYDWILVDIHNRDGMAPALDDPGFFADCQSHLSERGALAVNLWTGHQQERVRCIQARLHELFPDQVLYLPVARKNNTVALAFNFSLPRLEVRSARQRAVELERKLKVEFPQFLWELVRGNPGLVQG
jgi:spermidine synthase